MIFITLGSQKFQFNRLLIAIDELIDSGDIVDEVFAQIGFSTYFPKNYPFKKFLDHDEFTKYMNDSSIVITHGGTGAIVGAIKNRKRVIAVPRLSKYEEHVDDHQLQIIQQFKKQNLIYGIEDCGHLSGALKYVNKHEFSQYISNTQTVIESIEKYISKL